MNFRILEYWNFLQYIYMPKKNIFFLKWWKKIENNCLKRSDLFKNLFIFKTMVMCFIGSVKIRTVDWFSQRLSSRWNWNKKCKQSDFTTWLNVFWQRFLVKSGRMFNKDADTILMMWLLKYLANFRDARIIMILNNEIENKWFY